MEYNAHNGDDEISLLDLAAVLWQWKRLIIGLTGLVMIGIVTYAIVSKVLSPEKSYLPDMYTSSAMMLISDERS